MWYFGLDEDENYFTKSMLCLVEKFALEIDFQAAG